LWIDSDEPLTVMFINTEDYKPWARGEDVDPHELHEDAYSLNTTFVPEEEGKYSIVVCNYGNDEANIQFGHCGLGINGEIGLFRRPFWRHGK
jgi:hypothetical protein